jgi:hypothetical protein
MNQAYSQLQEAKNEAIFIVNKMTDDLSRMAKQFLDLIKTKQRILKSFISKGQAGNVDEILGQFRYSSFKGKELKGFADLTVQLLNQHFSNDPGEEQRFRQATFQDEIICIE